MDTFNTILITSSSMERNARVGSQLLRTQSSDRSSSVCNTSRSAHEIPAEPSATDIPVNNETGGSGSTYCVIA
ncbi:pheromone-like peptide [Fomitiporia mediterranea MF3/22]|uniref:pheromone-like peptide n=1 Tax=Fomitiporia mediterranea (strain MF3/22) TaxID=694068 RepID=UPI00044085B0|nr:pheromone-like peptide [Fomitiporia mediterranea MF3/22]EJD05116.1 pheromone-like peptide [Fomitiporia mediterranea MF3/22]